MSFWERLRNDCKYSQRSGRGRRWVATGVAIPYGVSDARDEVPLYTVLGTSVSFALTFAACDVANYVLGFFQATIAKPLIDSTNQVRSGKSVCRTFQMWFFMFFFVLLASYIWTQ